MTTKPSQKQCTLTLFRTTTRSRYRDDGTPRPLGYFVLRLNEQVLAEYSSMGYKGGLEAAFLVLQSLKQLGIPVTHFFDFKTCREAIHYSSDPLGSLLGPDGEKLRAMGWEKPLNDVHTITKEQYAEIARNS